MTATFSPDPVTSAVEGAEDGLDLKAARTDVVAQSMAGQDEANRLLIRIWHGGVPPDALFNLLQKVRDAHGVHGLEGACRRIQKKIEQSR